MVVQLRLPVGRFPRLHSGAVHLVDLVKIHKLSTDPNSKDGSTYLLERKTSGLWDEQVDINERDAEHAEEDEQDQRANAREKTLSVWLSYWRDRNSGLSRFSDTGSEEAVVNNELRTAHSWTWWTYPRRKFQIQLDALQI